MKAKLDVGQHKALRLGVPASYAVTMEVVIGQHLLQQRDWFNCRVFFYARLASFPADRVTRPL